MDGAFPILTIDPGARGEVEQMGSKPKFWFQQGKGRWLFKEAREGTGEDWAEKLASEVARSLGLETHTAELAEISGRAGVAVRSFLLPGEALFHGNELLGGLIEGYDKDKQRGQSDHTVANIVHALQSLFPEGRGRIVAASQMIGYLFLDALVGNTDRHHENWGIVLSFRGRSTRKLSGLKLAPTFDHASSLGRELTDEARARHLLEGTIPRYSNRGRGGVFFDASSRRGPPPMAVAEHLSQQYPALFHYWRERLRSLTEASLVDLISRIPEVRITRPAREFAAGLLCHHRHRLLSLP
jgi:hypothetical protein